MKKLISAMFFAVLAATAAMADALDTTLFSKKCELTVSGYSGSTALENFPVLVRLAAGSPSGFAYADVTNGDLRFADASGNSLPFEIETWNPSGESHIWVSVPSLSGNTTKITMYYGATSGKLSAVDASGVWKNAGYVNVLHFSTASGVQNIDSTENALSIARPNTTANTTEAAGLLTGAIKNESSMSQLGLKVEANAAWNWSAGAAVTVSAWGKRTRDTSDRVLFGTTDLKVSVNGDTAKATVNGVTATAAVGTVGDWNLYTLVADGTSVRLYVNGVAGDPVDGAVTASSSAFIWGSDGGSSRWKGTFDEARLRHGADSADWAKACYDTIASADFVTSSAVEAQTTTAPTFVNTFSGTPVEADKFSSRLDLTLAGYTGSDALENLPVLVRLNAITAAGFDVTTLAADGSNFRFADAQGNNLPFEIDTWDTTSGRNVWVTVPYVEGATTKIYLYFGTTAALAANDPTKTWTDAGYRNVMHFQTAKAEKGAFDSSGYADSISVQAATVVSTANGKIGEGSNNAASGATGYQFTLADGAQWTKGAPVTFSLWALVADGQRPLFGDSVAGGVYSIYATADKKIWAVAGKGGTLTAAAVGVNVLPLPGGVAANTWAHYTFVCEGSVTKVYVNGAYQGMVSTPLPNMTTFNWCAANGGNRLKGNADEVRLHLGVESADYVAASYAAMNDANFLVAGSVGPAVTEYRPEILSTAANANKITVTTRLTAFEDGASSVTLTLLYGTSAESLTSEFPLGVLTEPDEFTKTIAGLNFSQQYYLKVKAVDNLENESLSDVFEVTTGADPRLNVNLFAKTSAITVSGYSGVGTLENFPVLVKLAANSPVGFDYGDCQADGSDLRFTDDDDVMIPHEIESWDPEGVSYVWVCLPHLSGTDTAFSMYYGNNNPSGLPAVDEASVWTNSAHNAVWHFAGDIKDSANGLVPSTTVGTATYADIGAGVGKSLCVTGSQTFGYAPDAKWTTLGDDSTLTISTWTKFDGSYATYNRMLSCMSAWGNATGFELTIQQAINQITVGSSAQSQFQYNISPSPGTEMVYLTAVYRANRSVALFVNGAQVYEKDLKILVTPVETLWIASCNNSNNRWNGKLDEMRIHRGADSADWIKACYDTMANANFVAMDEVTAVGGVQPLAIRSNGATLSGTTATITGRLANLGTGATSADVTLYYGMSANVEGGFSVGPASYNDKADLSNTLTGLTPAATYYYAYKAVNNAPTPETAWTATNSFVVEASTRFSDTLDIAVQNCQMAVTGTMTDWGVGTTVVELLVGTSADNLVSVQTVNLSAAPANGQVVFDPVTMPVGTYVVAIRATTTYNDIVWVRETTTTSQSLADTSTYTWKGGSGSWSDASMWTSSDTGAGGYPTDGCSVVFPAGGRNENVVYLSSTPVTLAAIAIDSASRYTFRSTSRSSVRTIKAPTKTMTGAGGGTLVLDAVSIKGTEDKNRFDTLAGLRRLVLENSAEFAYPREAANSQLELSLVRGGKFAPYWTSGVHVGKLKVGRSITYIEPAGSNAMIFDGFENIGDMGYCRLSSDAAGKVSFADVSGIAQIGGEGTFENNPSQIKVAPEFTFYISNWHQNKGIAAISNNVVVALSASTMLQGFDGATSLDNVYVGSATTLTENKTVNAVMLENDLDLGGHTLTVVSGVVRMGPNGNGTVKNGTLRVLRPLLVMDNINNTTERFTAEIETEGNEDPWTAMFDLWSLGGSKPNASFSNFVGRVIWPFDTFTFKSGRTATNYVVDVKSGSVGTGSHNADYVVRGIAGNCELKTGMFNNTVWVGDCNDAQFAQMNANSIANWGYVVSTNGILAPGVLSYDGGRRGRMFMVSTKERMVNFLMDEGGTLQIAIHADGDNTYLEMTDIDTSNSWSTYINVTLAGTLDIREYGKIQTGVAYPVVFYHPGKRTGKFDRVTINGAPPSGAGYKVEYDVPQADGSYAVTVTKKGDSGILIIVR